MLLRRVAGVCLALAWLSIAGCVSSPSVRQDHALTVPSTAIALSQDGSEQWRQTCFRMPFDDEDEPDFTTDLILADKIISPVLKAEINYIRLWRFHRRAAHDSAGHQFSFIYYVDTDTATRINRSIQGNPVLNQLLQQGQVQKIIEDCRKKEGLELIEATSDPAWDPLLQRSWPYFIMGVSAAWLSLIEEISRTQPANSDDLYDHYGQVEEKLTKIWQDQGQHAYIHHLSAIFGYEPLLIRKWIRF